MELTRAEILDGLIERVSELERKVSMLIDPVAHDTQRALQPQGDVGELVKEANALLAVIPPQHTQIRDFIQRAAAALTRMSGDAERYRWLKNNPLRVGAPDSEIWLRVGDLEPAIDAARSEKGK